MQLAQPPLLGSGKWGAFVLPGSAGPSLLFELPWPLGQVSLLSRVIREVTIKEMSR